MKRILARIIPAVLEPFRRSRLTLPSVTFFTTPVPVYVSQFIGIYPQSIVLGENLTNKKHIKEFGAKNAQEFSFWSWRNCGIACVKMILDTKDKSNTSIMTLTHRGIALGGYVLYEGSTFVDKGWFHHSLVALLTEYGMQATMKKWQSLSSVAKDILDNKLVMLSVTLPGRSSITQDGTFRMKKGGIRGGHLLLATGVKIKNGKVVGIYAHDPRGLPHYQANTWIPEDIFARIFSGRTIVAD